ncbi:hypothetical protein GCM10011492_39880 [Flexivirga endophytica]|uniref:Uncharacterized protein n=1 Tax=Flexivirga endophytica TaxID=1849103 RepID=A0A916TGT5_9MICO|nr:hypothetical protein [Flexivirga endophytica]GGB44821.1 hypothetical protein GCM10011492_39880 [Flexivirga endophytica]GHB68718.1 hypothetical protein GCM10008112_41780 [Flexivirga endophytica]
MRQLREHPLTTLGGLLAVAFVLFMCSGIPALKNAHHGTNLVLGNICWFGFLLTALVFVIAGVYTLAHRTGHARSAS